MPLPPSGIALHSSIFKGMLDPNREELQQKQCTFLHNIIQATCFSAIAISQAPMYLLKAEVHRTLPSAPHASVLGDTVKGQTKKGFSKSTHSCHNHFPIWFCWRQGVQIYLAAAAVVVG